MPEILRKLMFATTRGEVAGRFLYCAADATRRRQQLVGRRAVLIGPSMQGIPTEAVVMPEELRAVIVLFFSLLDEKQRRLYAGHELLKTGSREVSSTGQVMPCLEFRCGRHQKGGPMARECCHD